jgi:hypothetical protein
VLPDEIRKALLSILNSNLATILQTLKNDMLVGDASMADAKRFLKARTERPTSQFFKTFTAATGRSTYSDADRLLIQQLIDQADGTTIPGQEQPPGPGRQPSGTGVQLGEGAVAALGDLFPQFAPFEGLAEDAVGVLVPALERWRPFQRCAERRAAGLGIFGPRSARGVYYIDQP